MSQHGDLAISHQAVTILDYRPGKKYGHLKDRKQVSGSRVHVVGEDVIVISRTEGSATTQMLSWRASSRV